MKSNKKSLYIILRKKDIKKIKRKQVICFSLCNEICKKKFQKLLSPDPIKTSIDSNSLLIKSEKLFRLILEQINIENQGIERTHLKELLKPYLDIKISIYLYLKSCIPKSSSYKLLKNGIWKEYQSKTSLIIAIENILKEKKGNTYNFFSKYERLNYSFFHKLLAKVQIILLSRI